MTCLTDGEIQAVADQEADGASVAHAAGCARCRARVDARRAEVDALAGLADARVPPQLEAQLRARLQAAHGSRGATVLRADRVAIRSRAAWRWALATAAALLLTTYVVLPRLGAPTTLSAAEILGRSLQALTGARGVERLEYQLTFAGSHAGPQRVAQLVDHDLPARYRIDTYAADGTLVSAIAQDPAAKRVSHLRRVDGRNYIIELANTRVPFPSLPQIAQAQIEAMIGMMQASADQRLTTVDTPDGGRYVIQSPRQAARTPASPIELYESRAVIDASDFRVLEFEASGALLKQPYALSFKLIRRDVRPSADVAASEFTLHPGPDDIVLRGEATGDLVNDTLGTVFRSLGAAMAR